MTNAKPVTDNKEKAKSRKKRDPLEIKLKDFDTLKFGDEVFTGADLAAQADALAAAKSAQAAIDATVKDAEAVLRAAMLRHYCKYYAQTGRAPEMRKTFSTTGKFHTVQQAVATVDAARVKTLKDSHGVNLKRWIDGRKYTISLGNASKETVKQIIKYLKSTLGDDYKDVVTEKMTVGEKFFESFDDIVKRSLGDGERLDEKMHEVMRILKPTIQFSKFETDLEPQASFDLAHAFAKISADKAALALAAKKEAKEAVRAEKKAAKEAEREAKREAKEAEREAKKVAKAAEKAAAKEAKAAEKAKAKSA